MKINQVNNTNIKRQNFNGLGDFMVGVNDGILKAGFAASLVTQDILGAVAPRVLTGLTRNSDKTGKLNYEFATMEAARELLTGPPIFGLPFAGFALAHKMVGGTVRTPVHMIEAFSDNVSKVCKNGINTPQQYKTAFYRTAWDGALRNTCGEGYKPSSVLLDKITGYMAELETSKNYTLVDKIKKTPKFRTTKDILGDISTVVKAELKSCADVRDSFSKVAYKDGIGRKAYAAVASFASSMSNFAKDSVKHIGTDFSQPAKVLEKVKTFKSNKVGVRVVANFAILAAALLYATQVPKMYKALNPTNPGLIGLIDDGKKPMAHIDTQPVHYEAFDKLKNVNNRPSFKGLDKLAKAVMKDGKIRKFANAFEFNGGDMSFWSTATVLGLGTIVPRVRNAYDKHDRREILTRDIITIAAIVAGAKTLQKCTVRIFEKITGFSLSEKAANYAQQSKPKRIYDHLRPFAGVQVLSNDDIVLKYANVDKFKGGVAGFCEYVAKTGGNIVKMFETDKSVKQNIEKMIGKPLATSSQEEIIAAMKNKKNAKYVKNIVNVFKNSENTFVKKAKLVTGVFGFMSTFVAIPAFMIFLQKLNEVITKRAIAKENAEKKSMEQKFTAIKLTSDMIQPDKSTLYMK